MTGLSEFNFIGTVLELNSGWIEKLWWVGRHKAFFSCCAANRVFTVQHRHFWTKAFLFRNNFKLKPWLPFQLDFWLISWRSCTFVSSEMLCAGRQERSMSLSPKLFWLLILINPPLKINHTVQTGYQQEPNSTTFRITEWFRMEGTFSAHWVPHPCHSQGRFSLDHVAPSPIQPGLNSSNNGADTAFLGNLFQWLTTLII